MPTKAELQARVTELETQLADQDYSHGREKDRIVKAALKKAGEHGWCDEVFVALKKMGLHAHIPNLYYVEWWYESNPGFWNKVNNCAILSLAEARREFKETTEFRRYTKVRLVEVPARGRRTVLDKANY